jgi:hypothetical protein
MAEHAKKPADAFEPGDRIVFKGEAGTVLDRSYEDGRKRVRLRIALDSGSGDRWSFDSGEYLEVGEPAPRLRRLSRLWRCG